MVVAVALAVAVAMTLPVTATLAAAILVGTLVLRRRRSIARRARAVEASALQGALDVLVGELRVGAHPVAAFDVAAREVDGPVAASLRAVAARARLGADVAGGLRSFAAVVASARALGATGPLLAVGSDARPRDRDADARRAPRHR